MPLRLDDAGAFRAAPLCTHLDADAALPAHADAPGEWFSVPLKRWLDQRDALLDRAGALGARIGVRLVGDDALAAPLPGLDRAALVVIDFPRFTDGRGYSQARLLRERYAYYGELRAAGDVLRDQIAPLARCGFDAFEFAGDGVDAAAAYAALHEIGIRYQPSTDRFGAERRRQRLAS